MYLGMLTLSQIEGELSSKEQQALCQGMMTRHRVLARFSSEGFLVVVGLKDSEHALQELFDNICVFTETKLGRSENDILIERVKPPWEE